MPAAAQITVDVLVYLVVNVFEVEVAATVIVVIHSMDTGRVMKHVEINESAVEAFRNTILAYSEEYTVLVGTKRAAGLHLQDNTITASIRQTVNRNLSASGTGLVSGRKFRIGRCPIRNETNELVHPLNQLERVK